MEARCVKELIYNNQSTDKSMHNMDPLTKVIIVDLNLQYKCQGWETNPSQDLLKYRNSYCSQKLLITIHKKLASTNSDYNYQNIDSIISCNLGSYTWKVIRIYVDNFKIVIKEQRLNLSSIPLQHYNYFCNILGAQHIWVFECSHLAGRG